MSKLFFFFIDWLSDDDVSDPFHPFSCINRITQLQRTADFPTCRVGLYHHKWKEFIIYELPITRKPWLIQLAEKPVTLEDELLVTAKQPQCHLPMPSPLTNNGRTSSTAGTSLQLTTNVTVWTKKDFFKIYFTRNYIKKVQDSLRLVSCYSCFPQWKWSCWVNIMFKASYFCLRYISPLHFNFEALKASCFGPSARRLPDNNL